MDSNSGITFLGIGNMGLAVVLTLLKAGFPVTIWNRTTSRPGVKAAIDAGATLEEDISKAISKNRLILICLLDYDTILASFPPTDNASWAQKTVVNLTNGTPRQARNLQTWLRDRDVGAYFDGAIMVTPQMIGGPHSFLVVSGEDSSAFENISGVLSPVGQPQYLGPDISAAARFDLAALSSMYGMFAGSLVGMALLKRGPGSSIGGVVKDQIIPFLTALTPYLGMIAETWDEEQWMNNLGNPLGMQVQGVRNIVEACNDEDVNASVMENLAELMSRVVSQYGSDAGLAGVGKLLLKS